MQGSEFFFVTTEMTSSSVNLVEIGIYQYLKTKGYKKSLKKFLKEASGLGKDQENLSPVTLSSIEHKKSHFSSSSFSSSSESSSEASEVESKSKKQKVEKAEKIKMKNLQKAGKIEKMTKETTDIKKPFQRVDPSKVKFLDDRLRTNDYLESKPSSYGDKAYQILAPTKGADFRKEKNKKKKGSYKGGQINTSTVHSIKFSNTSDDE